MVATAGVVEAGSFIGHTIDHFTCSGIDLTSAAIAKAFVETVETKATIVQLGALKAAGTTTNFAVESPSAWTAAALTTALAGITGTAAILAVAY